ncbi:hypothetical protein QQ020_34260 [Fulvivirgaceae bacterium BMA12]|uniref:Aminoglycoside phosphotransferase domain-containing protein n=1 Tax=Agaribacillus aureus TaxID=3051825 RepID=A0ABT8LJT4_9BACT|nr:hypothetical protein [Fulvivirgaceae bacterium BMA12]
MNKKKVDMLIASMRKEAEDAISLIETHISWVILTDSYVYKIKKPMSYSFLDYITVEKRRYYCYKELVLNRRITNDVYLAVVPIYQKDGDYHLDFFGGAIVDYAVKMKRLDERKLMIHLLKTKQISAHQIVILARKIAGFHLKSDIITDAFSWRTFDMKFADIAGVRQFLTDHLGADSGFTIEMAMEKSTRFLQQHEDLINARIQEGFQRDVHGDLHAKNIFLYDDPIIFDCIEFDDGFRQMDVLNEVAFCCMDLEANGHHAFSRLLLNHYLKDLPAIRNKQEEKLFIYFKAYRANVRAKVNALRATQHVAGHQLQKNLIATDKYLKLMALYLREI